VDFMAIAAEEDLRRFALPEQELLRIRCHAFRMRAARER
jgi:hypothetical protein